MFNGGVSGCTIPGFCVALHVFFGIWLKPQIAVSKSLGQDPRDHSQGRRVQGSDLPENEREAALREMLVGGG